MIMDKVLTELLAESHDDYSIQGTVEVFFNEHKHLVVMFRCRYYENPSKSYYSYAEVSFDECTELSRRMKVPVTGIPAYLYKKYGKELCIGTHLDAKDTFFEVLDCISASGARYRIHENIPLREDNA